MLRPCTTSLWPLGADMAEAIQRWMITEEFGQRLGCGVITAVIVPLWFLGLMFAMSDLVALMVAGGFFVVAAVFAVLAVRRARRVPRVVQLDVEGLLSTESRSGRCERPVQQLARVDIGTSLGVWPLRLSFGDGTVWRLATQLDDLEGFLAALSDRVPHLVVLDRNQAGPPVARPGSS